ncbi:phosphate ABC transporter permease PstA [Metabacillus sp. GX 13764]|uniref:phosphate ABC transporter permease PstA n=1 Tax=Metabacillus kandeliae TaxID=2900151 RepID=UPI001E63DA46|nr:phosphate ABC transporter permease PstA [Metabacillus kandeliae]MCD7034477.1 phosphate ABC transporter permease PstA [Metabacillus kandeliae]
METVGFKKKRSQSRYMVDKVFTYLLWVLMAVIFIVIFAMLFKIMFKGVMLTRPDFFWKLPDDIEVGGGIGPYLFNSFYVLIISLIISIPIGIGSGIYLSEYAPQNKMTEFIRTCVESLASVPSIVFGLFGYMIFVDIFGVGQTLIGAGITLSLLNLPVIARVTEEAIQAVPNELREASYAMGATKSVTIYRVVIPAALSGILTGVSLTACRAFGESAIILLAGGTDFSGALADFNPLSPGGTLPVYLWYVQSTALVADAPQIADKAAAILVIIVLAISLLTRIPIWLKERGMRRKTSK